jgi:hypothetical protein
MGLSSTLPNACGLRPTEPTRSAVAALGKYVAASSMKSKSVGLLQPPILRVISAKPRPWFASADAVYSGCTVVR